MALNKTKSTTTRKRRTQNKRTGTGTATRAKRTGTGTTAAANTNLLAQGKQQQRKRAQQMPAGGIMIANKQQWIRAGQKYGFIQEFLGGKSGQAELAKFHASQPAQLTTGQSAQQGRQQSAA